MRSNIKISVKETHFEAMESNTPTEIRISWFGAIVNLLITFPVLKEYVISMSSGVIIHF